MPEIDKEQLARFQRGELRLAQAFSVDASQLAALLQTGYTFFQEGRLEQARNIFGGLAILDPANPYVHGILGSIAQQEGRSDLALLHYDRALALGPPEVNILVNRGEVSLRLGRFEDALQDLRGAIELDPGRKSPAANRARVLLALLQELLKTAHAGGMAAVLEAKKRLQEKLASTKAG